MTRSHRSLEGGQMRKRKEKRTREGGRELRACVELDENHSRERVSFCSHLLLQQQQQLTMKAHSYLRCQKSAGRQSTNRTARVQPRHKNFFLKTPFKNTNRNFKIKKMVASVTFGTALILITAFVGIALYVPDELVSKASSRTSSRGGYVFFCFCFVLNFSHTYYISSHHSTHSIYISLHLYTHTQTQTTSNTDRRRVQIGRSFGFVLRQERRSCRNGLLKLIQAGAKAFLFAEYALCATLSCSELSFSWRPLTRTRETPRR